VANEPWKKEFFFDVATQRINLLKVVRRWKSGVKCLKSVPFIGLNQTQ